jgi:glycosyltransferase involved in cell wall biosynthesis
VTVGYFAPLPPAKSGVADYAADLLPLLPARVNAPGDVNLYHIGNNQLHREIYARAVREPGVVVLHDAVLHHFFLGSMVEAEYVEEFVYNYGEWARELARELWRDRSRSATDPRYFRYGMLRRLVERSRAVIVHNAEAARRVGEKARVIPHYFKSPALPDGWQVERWRAERGLKPSTMLFGVMGYLRESKRVMAVVRTFRRLRREGVDAALVLAGEIGSTDLARALDWEGLLRVGHMSEAEFWLVGSAVDVVVNLRYPASGETSGIGLRMMGIGKPVLTSDGDGLAVPVGLGEEEALLETMRALAARPGQTRDYGLVVRERVRRENSLERVAASYQEVLAGALSDGA